MNCSALSGIQSFMFVSASIREVTLALHHFEKKE
jgi:hypothetical protein